MKINRSELAQWSRCFTFPQLHSNSIFALSQGSKHSKQSLMPPSGLKKTSILPLGGRTKHTA